MDFKEKLKDFKEKLKPMLELEPIFINKLAGKLKPRVKIIYYILSVLCLLGILNAFVTLFDKDGGLSMFIIKTLLVCVNFVVARMFSEYLYNKD